MPAHARRAQSAAHVTHEHFQPAELLAGERIGRPLERRRGRTIAGILFLTVLAAAGSWAWLDEQQRWRGWMTMAAEAVSPLLASRAPRPDAKKLAEAYVPPPPEPAAAAPSPAVEPPGPAPAQATAGPDPATTTADAAPADDDTDNGPPVPLPPPHVDRADPLQVKAAAIGLHPRISRAVLSRLTDADFKNAAYAIKTALAETPDKAVLTWPRHPKADVALFSVRFVAGAPQGCRRYVVTITIERWLTTAPAMEKCGLSSPSSGAARNPG